MLWRRRYRSRGGLGGKGPKKEPIPPAGTVWRVRIVRRARRHDGSVAYASAVILWMVKQITIIGIQIPCPAKISGTPERTRDRHQMTGAHWAISDWLEATRRVSVSFCTRQCRVALVPQGGRPDQYGKRCMLRRWLVDPEFDPATCLGMNFFDAFVHTGSHLMLGAAHQFEQGPRLRIEHERLVRQCRNRLWDMPKLCSSRSVDGRGAVRPLRQSWASILSLHLPFPL